MKQNSSIMFHFTANSLKIRYLLTPIWLVLIVFHLSSADKSSAQQTKPEYLALFDPAKGFKPAQRDLTEIFLQIAGSLENYGSPEPYLRHMVAEHNRISALYRQKFGTAPASFRPAYMTDQYIDRLSANWNVLSPKLGLDTYAKDVGHMMRDAIKGTRGTGTILVDIFNQHQSLVFDRMAGKQTAPSDFDALKAQLISQLELDKDVVDEENYELARRDAISFALGIHGETMKLFKVLDQGLSPADAQDVKAGITGVFIDVGRMAQSELEVGLAEWALRKQTAAAN